MHKLALFLGAIACAVSALALPSSSSASTSDSLAALFSAHGHWVDADNSSVTWTPSDAESSTFRRQEHRWLPDVLSSSSSGANSPGLARLARTDILDCLAGETVTIWGDSTARVLYYGLINKLEPTAVTAKHANRVLTFSPPSPPDNRTASSAPQRGNATFEFRWDPVLGSNSYSSFRPFLSTGRLPPLLSPSSPSSPSPPPSRTARPPALLLFSLGLWYIDPRPGMYPLARVAQYQSDVRALLGLAARLRVARTALVIAEVERPVESKDDGGRWHPLGEVDEANEWLRGEVRRWSKEEGARARTRVVVGSVFNAMIAHLSSNTRDGLHYDLALAEEMADVVLHAVCAPAAAGPGAGAHEGLCAACAARAGGAAALVALLLGGGVWLCWTRELPKRDLLPRALERLRPRALGLWDRHGAPGAGYELVGGPVEERSGRDRGRAGGPCAGEGDEGPGAGRAG